jgi:hypothetical protein
MIVYSLKNKNGCTDNFALLNSIQNFSCIKTRKILKHKKQKKKLERLKAFPAL